MRRPISILAGLLAGSQAIQPSARQAVEAPLRDLPLGQLNFLHTTDTHGWHAGHLQEASYGADWGDYISFSQRLREKIEAEGNDLLLVDTGDRVEGNGLYDASNPTGKFTRKIFPKQDIDILCSGNHELYHGNTTTLEYTTLVPAYGEKYLASNLDVIDPKTGKRVPLSQRYRKFKTKNHGIRVTAFGFLFNFNGNDKNSFVQPVEETIKESWFKNAIADKDVDLFVVIGHVGLHQHEMSTIYKTIREVQWDKPIMHFGGHTHIRDYVKYDNQAYGLESGRYMETIGFQSLSGLPGSQGEKKLELRSAGVDFQRRYIDNNLYSFYHHTGLNSSTFPTSQGQNVSAEITAARKTLKLDETYGCSPRDLWMARAPYPHKDSIFSWLESRVLPEKVIDKERKDKPRIVYANTGAIRFDIFQGPFTRDSTFIVSPFTSGFRYIKDIPFRQADQLLRVLNNVGNILAESHPQLPESQLVSPEQIGKTTNFIPTTQQGLIIQEEYKSKPLTPGYTTRDDAGSDGDDTIHSPIPFYKIPNCIEARMNLKDANLPNDTVDVIFLEFIQPWVLAALRFLGAEYMENDTMAYIEGKSFTSMIEEWVGENWKDNC